MLSKDERQVFIDAYWANAEMTEEQLCEQVERAVLAKASQQVRGEAVKDRYVDLLIDVLDAKQVMRKAGIEQNDFSMMFADYSKAMPAPKQEPVISRITEQDAREIMLDYSMFMSVHPFAGFDRWLAARGRALLNKLNAKPAVYVAPTAKGSGDGSSEENSMSIEGAIRQDCIGFEEGSKNPHVWSFNTVDTSEPIRGNIFVDGDKPESVGG